MDEEMVELYGIDATAIGDTRYPAGTEAKVYAGDGKLVVKVDGVPVAHIPESYADEIRNEKDKSIVLGARVGDTVRVSVKVPMSRMIALSTPQPVTMSPEEMHRARIRLRKHGLDFMGMSDDELLKSNVEDIRDMDVKLAGSGLYSLGSLLSGNADTSFMIDLLKAQIRQQWVIARQNEQIIRLLREIAGKDA